MWLRICRPRAKYNTSSLHSPIGATITSSEESAYSKMVNMRRLIPANIPLLLGTTATLISMATASGTESMDSNSKDFHTQLRNPAKFVTRALTLDDRNLNLLSSGYFSGNGFWSCACLLLQPRKCCVLARLRSKSISNLSPTRVRRVVCTRRRIRLRAGHRSTQR